MTDAITEANILLAKGKKVTYQQYSAAVLALYDPTCATYNPDMEANYSQADMTNLLNAIQTATDHDTAPSNISGSLVRMSQIPGNYTTAVLTYMYGKLEPGTIGAHFVGDVDSWMASH
jgi:hypothetical protein